MISARRKMDLRNFFSSVKKKHHLANLSVQNFRDEEREAAEAVKKDKAQITATIFATEAGDILPYQMIFQGTTERCHPPKGGKPDDCLWTHTKSHWQSPQTYIELLEKVVVPYKNNMILALRLPPTQGTILKHDLHYTHKDEAVLAFMKSHNIYPLFVPAGCTDVMQECDVVISKPFKNAVRKAYRDHIDDLFQVHKQSGAPVALFSPKLTMGALKPFLTGFVQRGILALKTPEMRARIQDSFANAGFFTAMRSDEMQQAMELQANQLDDNDQAIDEGHENEENVEELGFTSDTFFFRHRRVQKRTEN